jgi:hypothetical protein
MYKRTRVYISKPPTPERVVFKLSKEETDKEYKECRKLEKELHRKYKSVLQVRRRMEYTLSNMQWIADDLCKKLGSQKVKVAQLPPQDYKECSHYDGKFIVLARRYLGEWTISTLLHELAHHIVRKEGMRSWNSESHCHSKDYLWVLEMLWDMWYGEMK